MKQLLRSTALALLFSGPIQFPAPNIFVYASAEIPSPQIPSWINAACCGPKDVHRLTPDQVQQTDDSYIIDGYPYPIPRTVLVWQDNGNTKQVPIPNPIIKPSQDANYYIFYNDNRPTGGDVSSVYCFFQPYSG